MSRIPNEEKLCEFLSEFANDECAREVLQLLCRHPRTRLSRLAIQHAVDWRRPDVDKALGTLINRRVAESQIENEQAVFGLTKQEPQRTLAVKVGALDMAQWQALLKRACGRPVRRGGMEIAGVMPAFRSSLSARDRDILAAARHSSAFVLPIMPKFTKG